MYKFAYVMGYCHECKDNYNPEPETIDVGCSCEGCEEEELNPVDNPVTIQLKREAKQPSAKQATTKKMAPQKHMLTQLEKDDHRC